MLIAFNVENSVIVECTESICEGLNVNMVVEDNLFVIDVGD